MLTADKIYQNKIKFTELLMKLGIDLVPLTTYLDSVDYFKKPYSSQYVGAYDGALCEHALNLYFELGQLANAYFPGKYSEIDIIKIALFKNIYRAELYETYMKNVKNETTGQWESVPAYKYRENRPVFGDLNLSSYMIAKNYVDFTDEQMLTILHADTKDSYGGDIYELMRKYPLLTLTKMAELAAQYLEA